ncbi:hypothetical protein Tco_0465511 [Tanacetum coccineum]
MDDPNITMEEYIRLEEEKARMHGKVYNWETATYGKIWYDEDVHDLKYIETEFPAIVFNDTLTSEVALSCEPMVSPLNDNQIDFRISFDDSDDEDYKMDDPNMTMKEYIKLEEEKAHRRGWVFNWQTATYGKIRVSDDLYDLRSVEAEFPAIVIDDAFAPKDTLLCKSQVSTPVNDKIDFRISFDKSDDEDYTIICDKNLFSYKMISVNNLKTDSENDNEIVGVPSFPPPKPTTMSEYNEEEQNTLYFNDIFPFNIIRPDALKSKKDNNDNDIDIIQSSEGNKITHRMLLYFIMNLYVPFDIPFDPKRYYKDGNCAIMLRRPRPIRHMAPLPPREQRHPFLRYEGIEYTDVDITNFEERLERIYSQEIHRVQVMDFLRMPELMRDGLFARMVMEHHDDAGVVVFTSRAWRRLFDARGPLVRELVLEFFSTLRFGEEIESPGFARYWNKSERMNPGKGDLHDYWRDISTAGDFLGPPPSYTLIRDPILRLCHRMMTHSIAGRSQAPEKVTMTDLFYLRGIDVGSVNVPYLLARYLRLFAVGRKSGAHIFDGQFVARLAGHFGLLTAEILGGLTVIAPELPIIDMGELVRLQICMEVDDTWAWVAMGPERQPDAAASAP